MFDPAKLTAAPWFITGFDVETDAGRTASLEFIVSGNDDWLFEKRSAQESDLEFVVMARLAFDVMMRRGWHAFYHHAGCWLVRDVNGERVCAGSIPVQARDPFTVLVEADRWYRENVDNFSPC